MVSVICGKKKKKREKHQSEAEQVPALSTEANQASCLYKGKVNNC